MALFVHTVRFLIGMTLLAGGAALIQPFAAAVLAARSNAETVHEPAIPAAAGPQPDSSPLMMGLGGHAIPDTRIGGERGSAVVVPADVGTVSVLPPTPPPPSPLPASGLDVSPAAPPLDGTYRSTVDIPPPPLLDGHAPPPLSTGWAVHDVARQPAPAGPPLQHAAATTLYVVRDGDDLTGIALKVYGHAGAATAIWAANRDRLADPQLLPIGLALQLPPTWTMTAVLGAQGGSASLAIEPSPPPLGSPRSGTTPAVAAGLDVDQTAVGGEAEVPWLQERSAEAPAASGWTAPDRFGATAAPEERTSRPATVRVGIGDSLESIADRFYGDRSMAARIWQANRDRVRSPELLVPGSDLRLP